MLQTNKPTPAPVRHALAPEFAAPADALHSLIAFVRRRIPVIVFAVILALGMGSVYLFTTPPSYTAQAEMIIDTHKVQLFQQQSIVGDASSEMPALESQVEILKSKNIALSVINDLHLTEDPEFVAPRSGLVGALFAYISNLVSPSERSSDTQLTQRALATFASRLTVSRVGLTYIIEINFRSLSPQRAAQIANAIADAYVVDQLESKYQATRRASSWLQDRIRELREQASTAERAVVEFKAQNDIVDAGGHLMNEQQLAELNSQLVITRAQVSEARARLDRIEAVLRADSPTATVDATVADTLKNDVITKLRSQYLDLANREADLSARYGRNHLAAVSFRNQMLEIRHSILDELRRIAETYKSDFEIAKQREEGLQKDLDRVVSQSQVKNQSLVALRELESNAQTYRALYDNFLQRYMESVQQQSFPITEARLISQADPPATKSDPKTAMVLAASLAGGILLGFGLAMFRDLSDRVFRTSGQVQSVLGVGCIAIVPKLKSPVRVTPARREALAATPVGLPPQLAESMMPVSDGEPSRQADDAEAVYILPDPAAISLAAGRAIVRQASVIWAVVDAPFSRFAEALRAVKLRADIRSSKTIGFTSSLPHEGKSTNASAFAELIAQSGARVILVDCDLRNPSISRVLTPDAEFGILDVISGRKPLEDVVWTDPTTGMVFLPAVTQTRLAHSNEVLASNATKKLFKRLRASYDYVVVDLSPLAPVVDVGATTHLMDCYVFVVEWGRTKIDVVQHALGSASEVYENLLGVVLNKANIRLLRRYEGDRGTYYYNKHYAQYGYLE